MSELPKWPEYKDFNDTYPWPNFDERGFERARAEAALARLRVAMGLLKQAERFIHSIPHGDNCYVSAHYSGDPGDRCNCGKEAIEETLSYECFAIGPLPK